MAVTMTYRFDAGQALSQIEFIGSSAEDMTPLMGSIGALLEKSARDRIEASNTAPDGTPWMPSDRVDQFGGRTLFQSGRLAASLTHAAGPDQVEVGSALIHAGVHQEGAIITAKNGDALVFFLPDGQLVEVASVEIPARPYLGVSAEDEEEIGFLVVDYFTAEART